MGVINVKSTEIMEISGLETCKFTFITLFQKEKGDDDDDAAGSGGRRRRRRALAQTTTNRCRVEQVANRDRTEPAYNIELDVNDDRSVIGSCLHYLHTYC